MNQVPHSTPINNANSNYLLQLKQELRQLRQRLDLYEAQQEQEQQFHSVFHQSSQFSALLSAEGTLLDVNQVMLDFAGGDASQGVGRAIWETCWWSALPETSLWLRKAIDRAAKGEIVCNEILMQGADNQLITVNLCLKPIRNKAGQVVYLLIEGQDITRRKLAQAEIQELSAELKQQSTDRTTELEISNRYKEALIRQLHQRQSPDPTQATQADHWLYVNLFKNLPMGLIVLHLDNPEDATSLQLVVANSTANQLTGLNLEHFVGKPLSQCFPKLLTEHRADLEVFAEVALTQKSRDKHEVFYSDEHIPGGFFNIKAFPLPGCCVGVAFENITDHKQAELAMLKSEHRYATLAQLSPVGIFRTDIDGNFLYVNERWSEITGLSAEEALGKGWIRAIHPEDRERVLAEGKRSARETLPLQTEFRFQRADGSTTWVMGQALLEHGTDGQAIGYVGTVTDITDRKQAELALQDRARELAQLNTILSRTTALLEERNRELDQFAYVASHDLRAPLRAISNLSEWIEEDLDGQLPEANQQQLQLLRTRVQRMEALINGLLEYSRAGRMETTIDTISVDALLSEVIDSIAPPPSFTIEIQPEMPTLTARSLLLKQVFANLIGNAIKHHHRSEGRITIAATEQGKFYEFAVSDDGPGIAPQEHQRVFAIFQTLEAWDTKESTGIGLSMVKKIVETEGGNISLESEVGKGAMFRFTWPKRAT